MRDLIVLINLDSVACRSMALRLRAEHVYCRVLPADAAAADVTALEARGVMLVGASAGNAPQIPHLAELLDAGLPVLAMGDAALTVAEALGGTADSVVYNAGVRTVEPVHDAQLFSGVEPCERYLPALRTMLPGEGCTAIATVPEGVVGLRQNDRPVYALAFLPEASDPEATRLLLNFCCDVCGCSLWWSLDAFIDGTVEDIRRSAGDGQALCALSGGVDSSVCAALGKQALGERLLCLYVDTGLMRKDESRQVADFYRTALGLNLIQVDAAQEFLSALEGVVDPCEKERIIYGLLADITRRELAARPDVTLLLRGTNCADVMDGAAPDNDSGLALVEPVVELFKDEIRRIGEVLRLPAAITARQPFPGSGLALRIFTDVSEEKLAILREADAIFRQEVESAGQQKRLWQYYACLAHDPVPCLDGYVVTLRAVQVIEGNVAVASRLPYDLLERVTEAILARLPRVNRVLYDFTPSKSYARYQCQ